MEGKILEQTENKTIGFKEVKLNFKFEKAVPSLKEVTNTVSKLMQSKEENIVVQKISPKFGTNNAEVIARVYHDSKTISDTTKLGKKALEKIQKAKEATAQQQTPAQ